MEKKEDEFMKKARESIEKDKLQYIKLPNEDLVTVKFFAYGTTNKGEKFGSQIINLEYENENFRKHVSSDVQSCELWIFSKTVHQMDKIRRGTDFSKELKELQILRFDIPKKTANTKLPDKETILDKIIKKVSSVMNDEYYQFKVVVHVIDTDKYFEFSSKKNAKSE